MHPRLVASPVDSNNVPVARMPDGTPDYRVFVTDGPNVTHLLNGDTVDWYTWLIKSDGGDPTLIRPVLSVWEGIVWQHEQTVGRATGLPPADVDEAALATALAPLLKVGATPEQVAAAVIAEIAS